MSFIPEIGGKTKTKPYGLIAFTMVALVAILFCVNSAGGASVSSAPASSPVNATGGAGIYLSMQKATIYQGQPDVITGLVQGGDAAAIQVDGNTIVAGTGQLEFNVENMRPPLGIGTYNVTLIDLTANKSATLTLDIVSIYSATIVQNVQPGNITPPVYAQPGAAAPSEPLSPEVIIVLVGVVIVIFYLAYIVEMKSRSEKTRTGRQ